jgi:hypothetical protein
VHLLRLAIVSLLVGGLLVLVACGDDSGGSASTNGPGTSVAAGDTSGSSARGSEPGGTDNGDSGTTGAPTTEGTTTTTNPVVPDAQATSGLVNTSVQMKFLAATVAKGQATQQAWQGVFDAWNVYDGTIQKKDPASWQKLMDALTAMQAAVTNKDAAAADAAASAFEGTTNAYLGSG